VADRPDLRIPAADDPSELRRGPAFRFGFEGDQVSAHPGETIASALLAVGIRELRRTRVDGRPRGLFCAIGVCYDCLVTVDGEGPFRACVTPARPDAQVEGHRVDP
jgi:predicted molibdopterin-dependent oxidoreductase YjgC